MPEEMLTEREHLRTGAAPDGAIAHSEKPPAGAASELSLLTPLIVHLHVPMKPSCDFYRSLDFVGPCAPFHSCCHVHHLDSCWCVGLLCRSMRMSALKAESSGNARSCGGLDAAAC